MKKKFILGLFILPLTIITVVGGSATLAWDPSVSPEVVNYYVYYGINSRTYTNKVSSNGALTCRVSNLVNGVTYYFAATAIATNGLESDFSNEIYGTIPQIPSTNRPVPPTSVRILE